MRTILNIDETLLAQARLLTDIESKSKLVREVPVARWWNGIARVISRVSTVVSQVYRTFRSGASPMILVGASVWVERFRGGNESLSRLLGDGQVGIHPFMIGEIACGDFTARGEILSMLECLPAMPVATRSEALFFLERNHIGGNGIGYAEKGLLNECTHGKTVALDIRRVSAPFRSCP